MPRVRTKTSSITFTLEGEGVVNVTKEWTDVSAAAAKHLRAAVPNHVEFEEMPAAVVPPAREPKPPVSAPPDHGLRPAKE